jgi:large subunit ribosomal protein L21
MKKAVITTGGKQYVVSEGDELSVELLKDVKSKVSFDPLLVIDESKISVGSPLVKGAKVEAQVVSADEQQDKVTSIRYKAKKRVRTVKGHRQRATTIKITKIA